jgi:hypothetical protein
MPRRLNVLQAVKSFVAITLLMALYGGVPWTYAAPPVSPPQENGKMTDDDAVRLGEEFGIIVGPVDEEIQQELKMQKAEGVVVFEVIGGTQADLAGIKVRAVIKEIDKMEVRNLKDFGRALKLAMPTCNFTVGTYEPADPETQGVGGVMNFHFVGCKRD